MSTDKISIIIKNIMDILQGERVAATVRSTDRTARRAAEATMGQQEGPCMWTTQMPSSVPDHFRFCGNAYVTLAASSSPRCCLIKFAAVYNVRFDSQFVPAIKPIARNGHSTPLFPRFRCSDGL
ncbi:hypothetical protein J6590_022471 [Homalodisca vitripennis]|nr:hypothetical protein J6590_022471 [Homalodisca vitripennis]